MRTKPGRAVLALTILFLLVNGRSCAACDVSQGPPVTMPKDDATADVVVRAYLAAVAARDSNVARALSTPSYHRRFHGWLNDPINTWADVKVSKVGRPISDTYGPGGYRQVQRVHVDVEIRRCSEEPPDDDRHYPYSFLVGRQADDAPWRILEFGGAG
ncbi:hypothetical protein [Streptosporangium sp. NPDC049376]|uniref:hypothetical protein n=1 Tax=Streptosporangium sp. NPDC049376 TaxID=3366192 RepID=UPI0037891710